MRRNPEATAWLILGLSFLVFCVLAITIPFTAHWYLRTATDAQTATLETISGLVQLQRRSTHVEGVARPKEIIYEGDVIKTGKDARGYVTLFDGSTVYVYPESELSFPELRKSKFAFAARFSRITLREKKGYSRVGVAPAVQGTTIVKLTSDHATVYLEPGSYAFFVGNEISEVSVRTGAARVTASGGSVSLKPGQRTQVKPGGSPLTPLPAAQNLVRDGNFTQGLGAWRSVLAMEVKDVPGTAEVIREGDYQVLRFYRRGSSNHHAENEVSQEIGRDVTDFQSLRLSLDLKIISQKLSGGGYMGSEYPVLIKIKYKDVYGNEQLWAAGFYIQNRDNNPTTNGEQVPPNSWYTLERDLLGRDAASPRMAYLSSILLTASGWDYESMVRDVRLLGE